MTSYAGNLDKTYARFSFGGFREWIVALIFISSFFVKIEPALTDLFGIFAIFLFIRSGLHFSRYLAAPLLLLIIYLVAGLISVIPIDMPGSYADNKSPFQYVFVLAYMSITGVFISAYITANPITNYLKIEKAYWIGAVIGSVLGLAIYFQTAPFFKEINMLGDNSLGFYLLRVRGGYKDPNVFSTWLVFPIISMMQALMVGRIRMTLINLGSFSVMLVALLLAFSRGAWIDAVGAAILTILLSVIVTQSSAIRSRLVLLSFVGVIFLAIILIVLLSVPSIENAFLDRFVLVKQYDAGETGRFGNQLNSIPRLLLLPFGFGPYQFQEIFGEAPHNTFLNAFASAGWLGGLAYLLLFFTNVMIGLKLIFSKSKFQMVAIPIYSTLIVMILQGLQIDNEHWRHLYWLMGMGWGLFAALREQQTRGEDPKDIARDWTLLQRRA